MSRVESLSSQETLLPCSTPYPKPCPHGQPVLVVYLQFFIGLEHRYNFSLCRALQEISADCEEVYVHIMHGDLSPFRFWSLQKCSAEARLLQLPLGVAPIG